MFLGCLINVLGGRIIYCPAMPSQHKTEGRDQPEGQKEAQVLKQPTEALRFGRDGDIFCPNELKTKASSWREMAEVLHCR